MVWLFGSDKVLINDMVVISGRCDALQINFRYELATSPWSHPPTIMSSRDSVARMDYILRRGLFLNPPSALMSTPPDTHSFSILNKSSTAPLTVSLHGLTSIPSLLSDASTTNGDSFWPVALKFGSSFLSSGWISPT